MFNPPRKQQSMQWGPKGRQPHSKPQKTSWTRNVMCTVWFNAQGVLMVDYLPPKTSINADYVQRELERLREVVLKKHRNLRDKPFILWDNTRPQIAIAAINKVHEVGLRLLNHPPYSPGLAIADFHLFRTMKQPICVAASLAAVTKTLRKPTPRSAHCLRLFGKKDSTNSCSTMKNVSS